MKQPLFARCVALAAVALTLAGCKMNKQDAPDLAGPSEFAQSLTLSVSPDVLTQDGASQSVVTVIARGPNGAPLANVSLRAEIVVNGVPTDFGKLSARNIVTDSNGRATVVYTAPASPAGPVVDPFTLVNIHVTPVGSDFGNSTPRVTTLRLVPPGGGVIAPPDGLQPAFTFTPSAPIDNQSILFDASSSRAPSNNPIVQYQWNFGDGGTATGITTTYEYRTPNTYTVTLTVTDGFGRSRSTSQSITVSAGSNPTSLFTFSPASPTTQTTVLFNAAASQAAPGRTITRYAWDFGDPEDRTAGSGVQTSHRFTRAGTYTVTLVVTDDGGRKGTSSLTVTVLP